MVQEETLTVGISEKLCRIAFHGRNVINVPQAAFQLPNGVTANLAVLVAGRARFAVKVPLGTRLASINRLPVPASVTHPLRHINIDFAVALDQTSGSI
jgi:hypothetical protein